MRSTDSVLGVDIDVLTWDQAIDRIFGWAAARESRIVCICNVHNIVTALQEKAHASSLRAADMATPDGAPLAWMLRRKGHAHQERISGPDLMIKCCEHAAQNGEAFFFYGATPETLSRLEKNLHRQFPDLRIAGSYSPPFRALSEKEDAAIVDMINRSGAGVVWVGLGCPKQEAWMRDHRGRINAVMIGVGAAFDFHAGVVKRAPLWMQRRGLEWLYRLMQDPRRLAKRYLVTNTVFILGVLKELCLKRWAVPKSLELSRKPRDVLDKALSMDDASSGGAKRHRETMPQ